MNILLMSILLLIIGIFNSYQANNDQIDLSVNLEIKQPENIIFNNLTRIAVDSKNNIYILDIKEKTIYAFDEKGGYKGKIGNPGQGPGEFGRVISIYIDSNDYIYALDNSRKVEIFDNTGKYVKSVKIKYFPDNGVNIIVDKAGNYYISGDYSNKNSILAKFSSDGELICHFPLPAPEYKELKFNKNDQRRVNGYLSGGSMCFDDEENIWISYKWPYLIYKFTLDGKGLFRYKKNIDMNWLPMIFMTDVGGLIYGPSTHSSNIFILKNKFLVNAINIVDWQGNPKVKIPQSALSGDSEKYFSIKRSFAILDLYSKVGEFVSSIEIEGKVSYVSSDKKGNILVIKKNMDDIPTVIRYEIRIGQTK